MWLITWFLSWLPDWFIHLIVLAGIAGFLVAQFIKAIPFVNQYNLYVKIASIVIFVAGVWLEGGRGVERVWEARVAELEAKIAVAEAQSQAANKQLADALVAKQKVTKEVQVVIQERIKHVSSRIDAECRVDPEVVSILNDAARNVKGSRK